MNDVQWDGARWVPIEQPAVAYLRGLGWRQLVHLVAEGYRGNRYEATVTGDRSDDGIDLVVARGDQRWFVQCKHWRSYRVDRQAVRALYGHMAAHRATGGILLTTGAVDEETRALAAQLGVQLVEAQAIHDLVTAGRLPGTLPRPSKMPRTRQRDPRPVMHEEPPPAAPPPSFAMQQEAFTAHLRSAPPRKHRTGALLMGVVVSVTLVTGGLAALSQGGTWLATPSPAAKAAASPAAPTSIRVGDRPMAVALDSDARRAYAANYRSGDISIIDLGTQRVVDSLGVPGNPSALAVDVDRQVIYVADYNGAAVYGFSLGSGKRVAKLKVAKKPDHLAVDSARHRLYVSSRGSAKIQVFDLEKHQKGAALQGSSPGALAVDAVSGLLHVGERGGGCVLAYDFNDEGWNPTCTDETTVTGIAVDGLRQRLYLAVGQHWIREINLVTGASDRIPVEMPARSVAVDLNERALLMASPEADVLVRIPLA